MGGGGKPEEVEVWQKSDEKLVQTKRKTKH